MEEAFKIYVDRLQGKEEEVLEETFSPKDISLNDSEALFTSPILLKGEAFVAEGNLVLHLNIETRVALTCAICNETVDVKMHIRDFYHNEDLLQIQGGVFNFKELLREILFLELPVVAECNNGDCPERKNLVKFLNKKNTQDANSYHPFSDL